MSSISIRKARSDDAEVLAGLNAFVQLLHHEAHPTLFKPPSNPAEVAEAFRELLEEPAHTFFLATVDSEPVGYLWAEQKHRQPSAWHFEVNSLDIAQLSVHPEHRSRGVGQRLVDAATDLAREKGASFVTLGTWAFNRKAQEFFERNGFEAYEVSNWRHLP